MAPSIDVRALLELWGPLDLGGPEPATAVARKLEYDWTLDAAVAVTP